MQVYVRKFEKNAFLYNFCAWLYQHLILLLTLVLIIDVDISVHVAHVSVVWNNYDEYIRSYLFRNFTYTEQLLSQNLRMFQR